MSIVSVRKDGPGDEYFTPDYIVEILLKFVKKRPNIKTIWCPCDKEDSEFVKVFSNAGYKVIFSHIDSSQDFLTYEPDENYDFICTNIPFSIKNQCLKRVISLGKPWAFLLSATCIQSASLIRILSTSKDIKFIMFDKRISYSGERPPFPSRYFTSELLDKNEFYIYQEDPKDLYYNWHNNIINT